MNKKLSKQFKSADLALVAFLSLHFPIEDINRSNPSKAIFSFKKTDKLNELVQKYWRQETSVEPQEYFDELRRIKSRIYARR